MNFFQDALGDNLIGAGVMKVTVITTEFVDGLGEQEETVSTFKAAKSVQPLTSDEAQLMGFADYGVNQFVTIYTLKEIPMPSNTGNVVIVEFNNRRWYVRKVLPWVWDEGTVFQQGYYEVTLSRFEESTINGD